MVISIRLYGYYNNYKKLILYILYIIYIILKKFFEKNCILGLTSLEKFGIVYKREDEKASTKRKEVLKI